ncbi:hypothetical protein EJ05DRAFT_492081 [Pseudovirgaria hyperparasitica]|uniref:Arrestin C-terminal-like domain-containing protein n=1 Tax=Pseudovirgaria hyperparasitica TaxID=470096 RepID=A0A6A6WC35_9PEZI|nr:uncharacterized protein EJ05DRAFT_492081 [Pseudovirgaria hyperparasitica]KAF2760263.1 hypothetical protein EJ05DRAFT_492081 [Pseudovirgaria hyperparasitica]
MVRTPVFGTQTKPILEIHPSSPFVVLYGSPAEAQATELTGKLVLTNPDSMPVKGIKMSLVGIRKVQWITNTVTPQHVTKKTTFLNQEVLIYPSEGSAKSAHRIGAGIHEWSFKFEIPGNTEESVEGLSMGYIVYNLNASVQRGVMTKDLMATQHIRVIRTLGQDAMESMPLEQINEDIWAQKIAYKIIVPQKNYIVGTPITADFTLVPLKKGLTIGKVKMEVIEHLILTADAGGYSRASQHTRELAVETMEQEMPSTAERLNTPEMEALGPDSLVDECYKFKTTLDLPKSLRYCRQTVDTENIKIIHKLRIYVNLHNPEGHVSQLLVKNHLHLFISPNLPPNEDQSVVVDPAILASTAVADEVMQAAPPLYGRHQLDSLYHEIDPSDFHSQPASVVHTPFQALSRNPSNEHLQTSIDSVADVDQEASASVLHSRLVTLRLDQDASDRPSAPQRSGSQHSFHTTSHTSTPSTAIDSTRLPEATSGYFPDQDRLGFDMSALSRIPSYNTAVRTPLPTPLSEDLPTYDLATSQPSSPNVVATMPRSERNSPSSSVGSPDTLQNATLRNTHLNSRRGSPTGFDLTDGARR